jgi:hypothetical protein
MLVPQYWAEARRQHRSKKGQVTLRRVGWSDSSQADAQAHAEQRAEEAMGRWLNGEKRLSRRERKATYNGAAGMPIREEILSRHGEAVITRNIYGARCLNTPNVLFADVDFAGGPRYLDFKAIYLVIILGMVIGLFTPYRWQSLGLGMLVMAIAKQIIRYVRFWRLKNPKNELESSLEQIRGFIATHPDWHLRVYRTSAGLRVMALHRLFDPQEAAVAEFFQSLRTDEIYARMCANQNCFRARLSPKPWRIGISDHLKPRPGVWPIKPERLPERLRWVTHYENTARAYAACRLLEDLGSPQTHPTAQEIVRLHDEQCQALSPLPLA